MNLSHRTLKTNQQKPKYTVGDQISNLTVKKYLGIDKHETKASRQEKYYLVECRHGDEFKVPQSKLNPRTKNIACPKCIEEGRREARRKSLEEKAARPVGISQAEALRMMM